MLRVGFLVMSTLVLGACTRAPSRAGRVDADADAASADAARAQPATGAPASSATPMSAASASAMDAHDAGQAATEGARTIPMRRDDEGRARLGESADFPAVNHAGTEIVLLAHDALDFAGTPVEHVLFREAKTGRTTLDAMVFDEMAERNRTPAQVEALRRKAAANVADANKRLAATTWRTLEAGARDGDARVKFGADVSVELPPNAPSEHVVAIVVRRSDGGAVTEKKVSRRIPALASPGGMTPPTGPGPCGWVQSVDGWADPQRRFVVLALHPVVSGDSCTTRLDSETMLVLPL